MPETTKASLIHRLPLTRLKLFGARCLYRAVRLFVRDDQRQVTRGGIHYDIDLSEGIDLSLFLFGNFQSHVSDSRYFSIPRDAVIFDVGANIGSMCLNFAKRAPEGLVYAFEPTEYAYNKLLRNLSLNPDIAARIQAIHAYVSNHSAEAQLVTAYSSWKVDGLEVAVHPIHGGLSRPAEVSRIVTIDEFCRDQGIERVDLIKTDTDGHELDVLQGARETLRNHRPVVVFEIGDYLLRERGHHFGQFLDLFDPLGYRLINSKNGMHVTLANYGRELPLKATTDLIALPL
ncbi:MAG: FkbM family methyltransferase [Isosphaerales bacterium]